MTLIYHEHIVDLGPAGILALTLDGHASRPLPAGRHGYARWHDPDGAAHDRLAVCTAGPEGRLPRTAATLGAGHVLLIFGGATAKACVRVIDATAGTVVAEEGIAPLAARLGSRPMVPGADFDGVWHGGGGPWAGLWFGSSVELLTLRGGRLECTAPGVLRLANRFACTPSTWFVVDHETTAVRVLSADDGAQRRLLRSAHARGVAIDLAAADGADRCVLSHPGGTIELVDGSGERLGAWRPFPAMSRKDSVGTALTFGGRFALCAGGGWEQLAVDLDTGRQAPLPTLPYEQFQLDRSSDEVRHRASQALTDSGWFTLQQGRLSTLPLHQLDWQPTQRPAEKRRAPSAEKPAPDGAWAALRRPALALAPCDLGHAGGRSQLYGRPHLARAQDWPRHDGRPMLLLCQVDLADVGSTLAGMLPAEGGLLFFAAADAENEVLLDECFNPAAWQVIWTPSLAAGALPCPPDVPAPAPAQALRLAADAAQWPQPDAVNVAAQGWDAQRLEDYRQFVDSLLPDGPAPGHRLGGYPTIVQHNDLELDAAHETAGATDPAAWRLLLQLASDEVFMWGTDTGLLYFMIHEHDLVDRDFSRVVALTQGH